MNITSLIRQIAFGLILASTSFLATSCEHLHEDLPECRLEVRFKYDYHMKFADAFHVEVDKVVLYVFDEEGKFLFTQTQEGAPLQKEEYRMPLELQPGKYKFMAWAGAHESYDITPLTPGVSTITELQLKLKREASLIIDKDLEPLWYGEIIDINFTGTKHQTETINLIKDTNTIRFIFQVAREGWSINVDDFDYEIIESNGYMNYDNSLLPDDILSYQPYYKLQKSPQAIVVELNTMRLMADRQTRFVVTEKGTDNKVFDINLIDYLTMTQAEGYNMSDQEYLDRQDEYIITFFLSDNWLAVQITINGWTYYLQNENNI